MAYGTGSKSKSMRPTRAKRTTPKGMGTVPSKEAMMEGAMTNRPAPPPKPLRKLARSGKKKR